MSRPIYEPNLERTDAALGYDKAQLQRRPAPLGSSMNTNLAMAWIAYDQITVPSGLSWFGLETISEAYTNPAAEEVLPGAPGGEAHMRIDEVNGQIDFTSGGAASEPDRYGMYTMSATATFLTNGWAGVFGILISINPFGGIPVIWDPAEFRDANLIDTVPSSDTVQVSFETILNGNASSFVGVAVQQDSGSDVDVASASLILKQIGWFSDTEGTFFPATS